MANNNRKEIACLAVEDLLPEAARTWSGIQFYPRLDRWAYREDVATVSLNFAAIKGCSPSIIHGLKRLLLWYAENHSPFTVRGGFSRFKRLIGHIARYTEEPVREITSNDLINYRSDGSARYEDDLSGLAAFLKKWHELGIPGVADDAVAFLKMATLKGYPKGVAVTTWDPFHGPFTDIELESIQSALNRAYAGGEVDLGHYILAWLFMMLGQRPVQYALLKLCDVTVGAANDGSKIYAIRVPRAKQFGVKSRTSFTERLLVSQVGEMLVTYCSSVEARFTGVLPDPTQAPLFPEVESHSEHPPGFEFHRTSASLAGVLVAVLRALEVSSERTGKPLSIHATRFRRTIGTRAAAEGHGELVIAELLDHSDTQNVGVYVQSTPEIVERIDRSVALHLAPLAQAFAGKIIDHESEATRGNDPSSRIVAPQFDPSFRPVGNCGQYGFCGFMAPLACYTCTSFQAWLDGPHEAVLAFLVAERERLLETTDARIASVNDRTILAVALVVKECGELRNN